MDEKINIKSIILKILSKWYYFLVASMITLPLAYLYIQLAPVKYEIKSSILLKGEDTKGPENFMKGMELLSSQIELEDEIGILQSFATVSQTVNTLDFGISYFAEKNFKTWELYDRKPFTIVLDSSANQVVGIPIYIKRISSSKCLISASQENVGIYNLVTNNVVGRIPEFRIEEVFEIEKPFVNKYLSFRIVFDEKVKMEDAELFFKTENLENLARAYASRLSVKPVSLKSNIVEVALKEEVPQKGIDFVNRLTAVYLENQLFKKNQLGLKTIQFIDNQISGVSDSLKSVEGSLESYRAQNNVLDIRAKAENLTRNLDMLEQQKADIEVKLKYYRYISKTLDTDQLNDIVAPSTFGVEDPLLNSLLVELSKLNQEKSGLNYSTREGNPLAEVIELKIKNNKNLIKENVSNIINASSIALDDLNRRIAQYNAQLNRLPRNERELVKIQRRFDFSDNVYNYLLEKRAEAGIAIASNVPNKTIIDSAMAGTGPVWPNTKLVYLISLVIAFGGAIGLIVLKDALNDSIITHDDLLRHTKLPFLGAIIHGSKREQDGIVANALSPVGESFRTLRVNMQYLTLGAEVRVIGFTSSRESEGKTFCAVNLAASMAHSRKRTVLIDADMRRPRVASYFQMEVERGLSSYLIGESSVKDIINETGIKGFDVITAGPIPPNPLDLIGQPRMGELLNELRKLYDVIIIDSPPIGYVSEYVILMRYTDANIYVVRSEYTTRFNLERVNKLYEEKKINNFSVLLNDVKYSRSNGYSYSYKYKQRKHKKKISNI